MKSIIFNNVSYSYGEGLFALKNISLQIEKGSYVAIVGHNGSGKSTLGKLLIGLLPLDEGEIIVNGIKLQKENLNEIRKQTGVIFQNPDNQFIGSTVEEDIAFGLENKNIPHEEMQPIIHEVAQKVGMESFLKKEPSTLSGGQKQRVAFAGVLALSPKILILDEATSMLDPRGRREIHNIILKMRELNPDLTIISITHDVEEAYLADEVLVLDNGKIIKQDTPQNIFNDNDLIKQTGLYKPFLVRLNDKIKEYYPEETGMKNFEESVDFLCRFK